MANKSGIASQLDEIRKKIALTGSKESSFITIEILFFDALNISRLLGDDPSTNKLLAALKDLEHTHYKATRELFRKTSQKEVAIKKFIVQFKTILKWGIDQLESKSEKHQNNS